MATTKLKSIELIGFKTFALKTKFNFDERLTVITGPNGSGKSNIVDALLWALGEREIKNLRISKSQDLIFSVSGNKRSLGMASVTLFLKKGEKILELKRKITRDGLTDSFLNQKKVSLRELTEFLAKEKISSKSLNIIRQGESEKFVQSNGLERKFLLENVLGTKIYQIKKHQAELKLAQTSANLEQAKIILQELAPRYRSLHWQFSRYQKREEIEKRLKEAELKYFLHRWKQIEEGSLKNYQALKEKTEKEIEELEKKANSLNLVKNEKEKLRQNTRERRLSLDKKNEVISTEINKINRRLGKTEGLIQGLQSSGEQEIKLPPSEINSFLKSLEQSLNKLIPLNDIEVIKGEIKKIARSLKEVLGSFALKKAGGIEKNKGNNDNLLREKEGLEKERGDLEKEKRALAAKSADLEKEEEALTGEYQEIWRNISAIQEEIFAKKNALEKEAGKKFLFEQQKKDLEEDIRESNSISPEKFREMAKKARGDVSPIEEASVLRDKIAKLRGQVSAIGEINSSFLEEIKEVEKRYKFMKEEIEDLEKSRANLVTLIKSLEKETKKIFSEGIERINRELKRLSPFIFPKGEIKLVNQERQINDKLYDSLEIEIFWQKSKIRNINILSGGEKTLVALAILTSISLSCQPPFIVLDEADASLDAENSKKIANILKELSKRTQVILITHNQLTAKIAEVLYGIVMTKEGTSKAISYRLG